MNMSYVESNENIYHYFHQQWDNFPHPVMLIHKDRTILARNKTAQEIGILTGGRCCEIGGKNSHKGCQANQALEEKAAKHCVGYREDLGRVWDKYWVPLSGREDIFLHFNIDITEHASERLFMSE